MHCYYRRFHSIVYNHAINPYLLVLLLPLIAVRIGGGCGYSTSCTNLSISHSDILHVIIGVPSGRCDFNVTLLTCSLLCYTLGILASR
jgi:hypothetical protein